MYTKILRPLLFRFEPEKVHDFTINRLSGGITSKILSLICNSDKNNRKVKTGSLEFRNPIGLAAGMDKNGTALTGWEAMGFGFAECGTVTPLPQEGNSKPRIFRLENEKAIINRLGFNNCGADAFLKNITEAKEKLPEDFITGINIGKNKRTPLEDAYQDYKFCFDKLYLQGDYFTINVSSPNTEGLRQLQQKQYLEKILSSLQLLNTELSELYSTERKDLYLKISPDMTEAELNDVLEVCETIRMTGIIAVNTTLRREGIDEKFKNTEGGLSGKPLQERADGVISYIRKKVKTDFVIIGCGGVFNADDVKRKMDSGANLVQIYTGLIYEGPGIVKRLKEELNSV